MKSRRPHVERAWTRSPVPGPVVTDSSLVGAGGAGALGAEPAQRRRAACTPGSVSPGDHLGGHARPPTEDEARPGLTEGRRGRRSARLLCDLACGCPLPREGEELGRLLRLQSPSSSSFSPVGAERIPAASTPETRRGSESEDGGPTGPHWGLVPAVPRIYQPSRWPAELQLFMSENKALKSRRGLGWTMAEQEGPSGRCPAARGPAHGVQGFVGREHSAEVGRPSSSQKDALLVRTAKGLRRPDASQTPPGAGPAETLVAA